jgi:hypothetical protein
MFPEQQKVDEIVPREAARQFGLTDKLAEAETL